ADAVPPGLIAGGGHDATTVSGLGVGADHERLAAKVGVGARLDRGVERVHVDVRDDPHPIPFRPSNVARCLDNTLAPAVYVARIPLESDELSPRDDPMQKAVI